MMSLATRADRLEREQFAEACHTFRPWFLAHLRDPDLERRDRAWCAAAGVPVDATPAEIRAWFEAQPPTAWDEAVEGVIDLLMEHPENHAAIRAALARLAPHLGLRAGDPPLAILAALRAGFDGS
jgi:hypothetical protein